MFVWGHQMLLTYVLRTSTKSRTRERFSSIDAAVCCGLFASLLPFAVFWASVLSSRFRFAERVIASLLAPWKSDCCGVRLKSPLTDAMASEFCCLQCAAAASPSRPSRVAISEV